MIITPNVPPVPGEWVGDYLLLDEIGRGAMGRVFRARDRVSGEVVAVKALHPQASADDLFSLKQEFRLSRALSSPHLVPIYHLVVSERTAHIVMPLLRGQTLDRWSAAMSWREHPDEVVGVIRGIAAGLRDLHAAGLLHRDVKPGNIIVEPGGRVMLLDYGLATRMPGKDAFFESAPGVFVGTLAYVAPECVLGEATSPASDAFAAGMVLAELFAGGLPRRRPLDWAVATDWLDDHLGPLAAWSPPIHELVCALLRPRPAERPALADVVAALPRAPHLTSARRPLGDLDGPLLGRKGELGAILRRLDEGGGAFALVGGSGVGKTTLVAEALRHHRADREGLVLASRSHPGEHGPFRLLDQIMDELGRWLVRCERRLVGELLDREYAVLYRLFPTLGRLADGEHAAGAMSPEEQRRRLPRALARLLTAVHAIWPLVVWLDDVHWADDDGVSVITEVLTRLRGDGPTVVLSGRLVPGPMARALGETLSLGPLDDPTAHALARRVAGVGGDATDVEQLVALAEGNPALIVQLAARPEEGADLLLEERVLLRSAALSPPEREVLLMASVLGHPLQVGLLPRLDGALPPQETLHRLVQTGLVRRAKHRGADALEFTHDRLRVATAGPLTATARRALHGRLADALVDAPGADPEVVGEQLRCAGRGAEAGPWFAAAGERAVARLAFEHAAVCFRRAVDAGSGDLAATLERLADALSLAGRTGEAARRYDEAAALVDGPRHWSLVERAGVHFLQSAQIDAGLARLRLLFARLGRPLPGGDRRLLLRLVLARLRPWQHRGRSYRLRPEPDERHGALADLAFATSTRLAQVDLTLGAYVQHLHYQHGVAAGSLTHTARALIMEGGFLGVSGGDEEVSRRLLDDAAKLLSRGGTPELRALHSAMDAGARWSSGDWEACERLAREAERVASEECVGAWWALSFARSMRLDATRWMGRYRDLAVLNADYLEDARRRGDVFARVTYQTRFSSLLALLGDAPDRAWAACDAVADWVSTGVHLQHLTELHARAECLLYAGRPRESLAFVEGRYRRMRRSPILFSVPPRLKVLHQLGACRLAVAAVERRGSVRGRLLRTVPRIARKLRRIGWGYARLLADLLELGAARIAGRAGADPSALASRAEALEMRQFAAALRWTAGADGIEGAARADRWAFTLIPGIAPPVARDERLSTRQEDEL